MLINLSKSLEKINLVTLGYIDPAGNFYLHLKDHHIDPFREDALGFFKKMTYNDKLKEI